jgi:hypothetical protein
MEFQTAPAAPSTPAVLSAPAAAQIPSAKTFPTSPAAPVHSVHAAQPAPIASPTPSGAIPSVPPAQSAQTGAPPAQPTVPTPPAPLVQPTQAAPTAKTIPAPDLAESTTVLPTSGDETAREAGDSEEETLVTRQIITLWTDSVKKKDSLNKTKEQLGLLRAELGKHLFVLKNLLAKTGRDGRWIKFLRGEEIPRATADRYVASYKRSLEGENGKRLTEALSVPTEEEIKKMVVKLTPRLLRALPTPESIVQFIREMTAALQPSNSAA